jgi:hypothetical protein
MFGNSAWGQNNQQQQNTGGGLFGGGGGSTFGQQQNTGTYARARMDCANNKGLDRPPTRAALASRSSSRTLAAVSLVVAPTLTRAAALVRPAHPQR